MSRREEGHREGWEEVDQEQAHRAVAPREGVSGPQCKERSITLDGEPIWFMFERDYSG